MPVCSSNNCMTGSKSKHVVKIKNQPVTTQDPYMRNLWQEQAQHGYKKININFDSAVICSLHFAPYYYNNNSTDTFKLKPDAIPLSLNGIDYYDVPFIRSTTPIKEPSKSPVSDKLEVITTPSGKFYVENIIPDPNSLPESLTLSNNVSRKRLFDGNKSLSIGEDLGVKPLILVNEPIENQIYK